MSEYHIGNGLYVRNENGRVTFTFLKVTSSVRRVLWEIELTGAALRDTLDLLNPVQMNAKPEGEFKALKRVPAQGPKATGNVSSLGEALKRLSEPPQAEQ